jgi:DNA-binding phage protein
VTQKTKNQKSKLDPFAADLDQWFGVERLTLKAAAERLLADKHVDVSQSELSRWWAKRQIIAARERLFDSIANGTKLAREVEGEFAKNPAPTFDVLCKLLRTIALHLSAKSQFDPALMKIAKSFISEAVKISSSMFDKEKFDREIRLKEEELKLDLDKFQFSASREAMAHLDELRAIRNDKNLDDEGKLLAVRQRLFGVTPA